MSRLRRLKERKRKNRIKATACSLAFALVIGSAQGLGTYALFTDTEDVDSNLAISTGDVDVEIGEDFSFKENMEKGKEYNSDEFNITNNGTLKQKIYLKIKDLDSFISKVNCKIELNYGDKKEIINLDNFQKLENYINTGFILNPGQSITYKFVMKVKDATKYTKDQSQSEVNLQLEVLATQIGTIIKENYGFYDIDMQKITAAIKQLAPDETHVTIGKCGHGYGDKPLCSCNNNALKFEFDNNTLGIDKNIFDKFNTVSVFDEKGKEMFSPHIFRKSNGKINIDMVINNEINNPIMEQNLNGRVINMYFTRTGIHGQYDKFEVRLSQSEPGKDVIFKWEYKGIVDANKNPIQKNQNCIMDNQIQGGVIEDVLNEDIVEPGGPELPKEEVEVSNESVVEPPKVEEIVVPDQTDIIAPKEEEIEIQE